MRHGRIGASEMNGALKDRERPRRKLAPPRRDRFYRADTALQEDVAANCGYKNGLANATKIFARAIDVSSARTRNSPRAGRTAGWPPWSARVPTGFNPTSRS